MTTRTSTALYEAIVRHCDAGDRPAHALWIALHAVAHRLRCEAQDVVSLTDAGKAYRSYIDRARDCELRARRLANTNSF